MAARYTIHDLKYDVDESGSLFFSRATMKFHGDTMRNFGMRKTKVRTNTGEDVEVYQVYRKNLSKFHLSHHSKTHVAYFCVTTKKRVHAF